MHDHAAKTSAVQRSKVADAAREIAALIHNKMVCRIRLFMPAILPAARRGREWRIEQEGMGQ